MGNKNLTTNDRFAVDQRLHPGSRLHAAPKPKPLRLAPANRVCAAANSLPMRGAILAG